MTDTIDTAAIRAQMDALTGWTGKPHVSAMEFGPNVAVKARNIIGQLCDALDAERANVGRIGRELNVEQAIGAQLSDLTYEREKALRAENERLRAALRPFAAFADLIDLETTGFSECDEFDLIAEGGWHAERFTLQEFRSARAALAAGGQNEGDA